ncbi:MAG: response regulator [Calditrichaeota bacterium]|nr:response regulator [Calditrichota bacterium]
MTKFNPTPSASDLRLPRFWVIEDDYADFFLLQELFDDLEAFHGELVHITSLQEAGNRVAKSDAPALVLLDLHLPDGAGLAAYREVRRLLPNAPILVLSGTENPQILDEILRSGAIGAFAKGEARLAGKIWETYINFSRR